MCFLKSTCLGYTSIPEQPERATFFRSRAQYPHLSRFVCPKGVAKDFKQPCFALAAGSAKCINRRADADIATGKEIPAGALRNIDLWTD